MRACRAFYIADYGINTYESKLRNEQLEIIDYSFEKFYQKIANRAILKIKTPDGYNGIVCFFNRDSYFEYDTTGHLINARIHLVKIDSLIYKNDHSFLEYKRSQLDSALKNSDYISENSIFITRDICPVDCEPIKIRGIRD